MRGRGGQGVLRRRQPPQPNSLAAGPPERVIQVPLPDQTAVAAILRQAARSKLGGLPPLAPRYDAGAVVLHRKCAALPDARGFDSVSRTLRGLRRTSRRCRMVPYPPEFRFLLGLRKRGSSPPRRRSGRQPRPQAESPPPQTLTHLPCPEAAAQPAGGGGNFRLREPFGRWQLPAPPAPRDGGSPVTAAAHRPCPEPDVPYAYPATGWRSRLPLQAAPRSSASFTFLRTFRGDSAANILCLVRDFLAGRGAITVGGWVGSS